MTLSKHAKEIHLKAVILHSNAVEPVKGPKKRLAKRTLADLKRSVKEAEKALK